MVHRICFFLLFIFLVTPLLSQPSSLAIRLQNIPDTEGEWELRATLNLNQNLANGFVVQVSENMPMIPVTVRLNNRSVWLQNLLSVPQRDSVIAWQKVTDGIMFLCQDDFLKAGDVMEIIFMVSLNNSSQNESQMVLREIVNRADGVKVSNQSFVSGTIPAMSKR
ncbi:MAG: hypothetical protein Kow0042_27830 [Calditrichia bacterium]